MTTLPPLGGPVTLRDAGGFVYASRVEDVDESTVTVGRPADLRAALEYDLGLELAAIWTMPSGIHVLPTRLTSTSVDRYIRLWHLAITGAAWSEQRRDYVRVPLTGRIMLSKPRAVPASSDLAGLGPASSGPGPEAPIEGAFLDLSEVAALCSVPLDMRDPAISIGSTLRCQFMIIQDEFDIDAEVVVLRPGPAMREARVVLRFDASAAAADVLRKHVFRIQLEMRRQRRD